MTDGPMSGEVRRAVSGVRAILDRARYTRPGISAIGIDPGLGVREPDVPILLRALEPVEPLATLVRLFLLGRAVEVADARRVLGAATESLAVAGFTRLEHGRIVPALRLTPWRDLVIAHDPDPPGDLWESHVAGPTPAADALLQLVAPAEGAALDLGTGCGLLALALAAGARRVVATDVNDAALGFARLNAELNGVANVELRAGDFFEPVRNDRFDLVVSNPPFVISPRSDLVFRYTESERDEVSREVTRGAAAHLAEGGFAYVMCNWIVDPGTHWLDVPRRWVEETGCDALWLLHGVESPLAYAVRWNAREQHLRPETYPDTLGTWLDHFHATGIHAIASGAVVLRRRTGSNWIDGLELPRPGEGDAGAQIGRIFGAHDLLARADDSGLSAMALTLPAAHRLDQSLVARDGEYSVQPAVLVPEEGLALSVAVEPDLIPVVLRFDGSQRLGEIVDEVAAATGEDRAALSARVLELVRALLLRGFAVRV